LKQRSELSGRMDQQVGVGQALRAAEAPGDADGAHARVARGRDVDVGVADHHAVTGRAAQLAQHLERGGGLGLARVIGALTPQLRSLLEELSADTPTRIVLKLSDGRVIRWGDAERSDIKATVATALLDRPARIIDVSVPDVATTS